MRFFGFYFCNAANRGYFCGTASIHDCCDQTFQQDTAELRKGALKGFKSKERKLAGVAGFEPAHGGTKNRCLTAWLHPKAVGEVYNGAASEAQAFPGSIFELFGVVFPRRLCTLFEPTRQGSCGSLCSDRIFGKFLALTAVKKYLCFSLTF